MNGRASTFGLTAIIVSIFMIAATGFAASHTSGSFKAYGIVAGANPKTGTITVTINKASGDLDDEFFGKNVVFHAGSPLRVSTCSTSCWSRLSASNAQPREAETGEPHAELSQIQNGAPVYISGNFNRNTGRFTANQILEKHS